MTILFVAESKNRSKALDLLNIRYALVKSDVDENMFPICTEGLSPLTDEAPYLRVEEFVDWYENVYPLTVTWGYRLQEKDKSNLICMFPPRFVLSTYSSIQTKDHTVGKIQNPEDLREFIFYLRDEGTFVCRSSLCVYDLLTKKYHKHGSNCTAVMRADIEDSLIEDYINTCEGFEGDGSFIFNGRALFMIQSLYGAPMNYMGLPLLELHKVMREAGVTLKDLTIV